MAGTRGTRIGSVAHIYLERRSAPEDPRFRQWLDNQSGPGAAGECEPPMDVIETAAAIELIVDLPGVAASSINVLFSQGTVIVAGRKAPAVCAHAQAAFHLAERSFGRFVRAVRLTGAFEASKATAKFEAGELHVVLPRIEERRGRDIKIPVTGA
jgi:HSP20 family protein